MNKSTCPMCPARCPAPPSGYVPHVPRTHRVRHVPRHVDGSANERVRCRDGGEARGGAASGLRPGTPGTVPAASASAGRLFGTVAVVEGAKLGASPAGLKALGARAHEGVAAFERDLSEAGIEEADSDDGAERGGGMFLRVHPRRLGTATSATAESAAKPARPAGAHGQACQLPELAASALKRWKSSGATRFERSNGHRANSHRPDFAHLRVEVSA